MTIKEPFRFFLDYIEGAYASTLRMDLFIRDRVFSVSFVVPYQDQVILGGIANREYERAWGELYTLARNEGYLP